MKTIEMYSFNELSDDAKINALTSNMYTVRKSVDQYLREIWVDYMSEIEDLLNCTVSVDIMNWNVFTTISTHNIPNYTSVSDVKAAISALVKKAEETRFYFTDELKEIQTLYNGETYISFIRKFICSLDVLVSDWAARVADSPAYVLDCINGEIGCICCIDDLILSDKLFDKDGNEIIIKK